MTKTFETVLVGTVAEVLVTMSEDSNQQRGEFVVLVEGYKESAADVIEPQVSKMLVRLLEDLPIKKAAAIVSDLTGVRKKDLYELGMQIRCGD